MEHSIKEISDQKIKDINSLIKFLEENIQDNENLFLKNIVKAQIAIFQFLKDPEFGIHLVDSIFEYIEKAFIEAKDKPNELWIIKEQAATSIRALITIQHAFVLLAYRAKEREAKNVLEAGVETLINSVINSVKNIVAFNKINVSSIIINIVNNKNKNLLQKFVSWIFTRKEYERKRKQFIWVLRKILEKVYRQRYLFEHTSTFKEVTYTALDLLDKYKSELIKENLDILKDKFSALKIIFVILAIIWMVFLMIIYFFSWIPSTIFNLAWSETVFSWVKVNFKISLSIGILLFLAPKTIYWKEKLKFYFFKRKILKLLST